MGDTTAEGAGKGPRIPKSVTLTRTFAAYKHREFAAAEIERNGLSVVVAARRVDASDLFDRLVEQRRSNVSQDWIMAPPM